MGYRKGMNLLTLISLSFNTKWLLLVSKQKNKYSMGFRNRIYVNITVYVLFNPKLNVHSILLHNSHVKIHKPIFEMVYKYTKQIYL